MDNDLIHCWMKFIKIYFKYYFVTVSRLELKTLEKCISGILQVYVSLTAAIKIRIRNTNSHNDNSNDS